MVWVRNGSIDKLREVKFGESGSCIWVRDCNVGGCDNWASEDGSAFGSE